MGEYWPFYNNNLVISLHKYCVLLVIYEYISNSTKAEYEELRAAEIRTNLQDTDTEDIQIVEIITGDMNELRGQIAKLLIAFLTKEMENKEDTDKTYQDIMFSTSEQKLKDNFMITDYLGNLTRDERKIEQLLRAHKIGERWNRGTTVFKYDKKTYTLEHSQFGEGITGDISTSGETGDTAEDIEREEQRQQAAELDGGDGIEGLGENYDDGYGDDLERDEDE